MKMGAFFWEILIINGYLPGSVSGKLFFEPLLFSRRCETLTNSEVKIIATADSEFLLYFSGIL